MAPARGNGVVLELNRKRIALLASPLVIVVVIAGLLLRRPNAAPTGAPELPVPGSRIAGEVEVLNGTTVEGQARAVTRRLRLEGIDVVFFGTKRPVQDSTLVIVRRGGVDSTLAKLVLDVVSGGTIVFEMDSSRFVDVTVLLGVDLAFYPAIGQPR